MTKKDFQLIAATLANMPELAKYYGVTERRQLAEHFADALAPTNPRFKRDLFIQAATGVVAVTARRAIVPHGAVVRNVARNFARTLASDIAEDR